MVADSQGDGEVTRGNFIPADRHSYSYPVIVHMSLLAQLGVPHSLMAAVETNQEVCVLGLLELPRLGLGLAVA
jgi:hypothetical protein